MCVFMCPVMVRSAWIEVDEDYCGLIRIVCVEAKDNCGVHECMCVCCDGMYVCMYVVVVCIFRYVMHAVVVVCTCML